MFDTCLEHLLRFPPGVQRIDERRGRFLGVPLYKKNVDPDTLRPYGFSDLPEFGFVDLEAPHQKSKIGVMQVPERHLTDRFLRRVVARLFEKSDSVEQARVKM